MKAKFLALAAALVVASAPVTAQIATTEAEAPAEPDAIPLYGDATPGSASTETWRSAGSMGMGVGNVTRPTITPVLPRRGKANGTGVIVAPGGAFVGLSWDLEGTRVAHALADRGYTAFLLKYRLHQLPPDPAEAQRFVANLMRDGLANPVRIMDSAYAPALEDGRTAVRWVRDNAERYRLDPHHIGMIGFSAGAMTAIATVLKGNGSEVPDFVGYIYGPEFPATVPPGAPPLFVALAFDDPFFGNRGFSLVESWQQAKRPVELHVYQKGGHGFGLGRAGETTSLLLDKFSAWLDMQGFGARKAGQ